MLRLLVWQEIKRNMHPLRVLPLFALAMVLAHRRVGSPINGSMPHLVGAFSLHSYFIEPVVMLVAGAMGAALAADRRRGFTLTVVARGGSRDRYFTPKLLGAAASSAITVLLMVAGFYVMVGLHSPAERTAQDLEWWSRALAPNLYRHHPVLHDVLVVSTRVLAAAALSMVGVLAGVFVANEYVAMAAPPLFLILVSMALHDTVRGLSPYTYLTLWSGYAGPSERAAPSVFLLYWVFFGVFFAALARWLFVKKELS